MDQSLLFSGLIAFASTSLLLWVLEPVARNIGLVDHPGGRKAHANATPVVGGIAMFVGFAFAVLLLGSSLSTYRLLFAGTLLLVVVGVLDDFQELSAKARFSAQIAASLIMALGAGVVLHDLGNLILPGRLVSTGFLAVPVTVFATVGVINAVNMTDGIDGLAASLALVAVSALGVIAWVYGRFDSMGILLLLAGVLLSFLTFNLRPNGNAMVFMGDAGSMFLGFVLAWFLIRFSQGEDRLVAPVTALWIVALPLIDTISIMVRRALLGRSPFSADRQHFHHILMAAGFSPKQTLSLMIVLAAAAASVGLGGHYFGVAEYWMFLGFIALFALYFWATKRAWRMRRLLKRSFLQSKKSAG